MCFSAEASLGAAVALLPAGAYCVEAAWRKDRRYLPIAAAPVLFGLQQLCEAQVWVGIDRGESELARMAALGYLFFALAVWPVWCPFAAGAIEERGRKRWIVFAIGGIGLLFAGIYYLPIVADRGHGLNPAVVGHSIRYDLTAGPALGSAAWWIWPALYLLAVSVPLMASRDRRLRPLGAAILISSAVSAAIFEHAFASVWCFFAALLSGYLIYVLSRLPDSPRNPATDVRAAYSN